MNGGAYPTTASQIFCKSCGSPLVQASDWARVDEAHWSMRLWCPECSHEVTAILDQAQASYLSLAIEEGFALMLETLAELGSEAVDQTLLGPPWHGDGTRSDPPDR